MQNFINTPNIANYRRQLREPDIEKDPVRRVVLVCLLADELANDAESRLAMQVAEHRKCDLLARRQTMSGVEYWAGMHKAKS